MAQIIKHRRGSIDTLVSATAKKGELIIATGSVGNMSGPWVFVGETEGSAGAFRGLSKIYQGAAVPNLTVGTYGSTLNGTPFYSSNDKTLYILSNAGNTDIDLTGNIEGNTISNVTITSLTGSNAVVTNITGTTITGSNVHVTNDLNVGGKVTVTGDISGSNLNLTGNATIDGNIVLKGNISIGDQTTDLVTFGADVSSSILPDVHNAFDLGSSLKNWRNLHVSGTAYVDTLQARVVSFSGLGVSGDLSVSGSTFLGNGGDITVVSGSLFNDQLTNNRVVIVGTRGVLEDDTNFTFDGTELNIGQGKFTVQQSSGNVDTAGTLNVGGGTTIESTLTVTGSVLLKDTLSVSGATTIDGLTTINDNAVVNGVLSVTGNTQLGGNLYISGTLEVLGSSTEVHIQSNTVEINDNIILLNAYSPFERYAGIALHDSGSTGESGSFLWDSLNNYFLMNNNSVSSKVIGTTTNTLGNENSLTSTYFPIATGDNTIGNSLLRYSGTTLSFNTNKFTVDSSSGNVYVDGNVRVNGAGGSNYTGYTSEIVFKNSDDDLGFVSSTDTQTVTTQLLGYQSSDGTLVFSSLIDGGSY